MATARGPLNCPPPIPSVPQLVRKVPLLSNFWMRLLLRSATKTLPPASTAIPKGDWNCPAALPMLPHWREKVPLLMNFSMTLLPLSATKMFPFRSTATPSGLTNCPAPPPWLPKVLRKVPHGIAVAVPRIARTEEERILAPGCTWPVEKFTPHAVENNGAEPATEVADE